MAVVEIVFYKSLFFYLYMLEICAYSNIFSLWLCWEGEGWLCWEGEGFAVELTFPSSAHSFSFLELFLICFFVSVRPDYVISHALVT